MPSIAHVQLLTRLYAHQPSGLFCWTTAILMKLCCRFILPVGVHTCLSVFFKNYDICKLTM